MTQIHQLANNLLSISVNALGAELQSLKTASGTELLWQANPEYWPRHAPNLFPIVGRLTDDTLLHQGKTYGITQHGFARDSLFQLVANEDHILLFELKTNDESLKKFPFEFTFLVAFILYEQTLHVDYIVQNKTETTLPFSMGGHPAFVWPIYPDADKEAHCIEFACKEDSQIWQLQNGPFTFRELQKKCQKAKKTNPRDPNKIWLSKVCNTFEFSTLGLSFR